jgi:hypothetical protein
LESLTGFSLSMGPRITEVIQEERASTNEIRTLNIGESIEAQKVLHIPCGGRSDMVRERNINSP